LRKQLGPRRRIILGVDRLDYTKGIDIRLRAFEDVLRRGEKSSAPDRITVRDCVFCQIAVPTRASVDEYARLRRTVEEHVGRINGEFGEAALAAVHYLRRNVPFEELVALYVAADVMVVTPLRDGMNLVAKEYVACRLENTGTLVLSEFAGAAHELRSALLVNPYDIDGLATAMEQALRMDEQDMRRRMNSMRRALQRNDVFDWAASFIRDLNPEAHGGGR
jgi:trehalose 6-phosphate synthase